MILTKRMIDAQLARTRAIDSDSHLDDVFGVGDELEEMIRSQSVQDTPLVLPDLTKAEEVRVRVKLDGEEMALRLFNEPLETLPQNEFTKRLFLEQKLEDLENAFGKVRGRKVFNNLYGQSASGSSAPSVSAEGSEGSSVFSPENLRQLARSAHVGRLPGRDPDLVSEALLKYWELHGSDDDFDASKVASFIADQGGLGEEVLRKVASSLRAASRLNKLN